MVRTVWDDEEEEWYFSIVDVCGVLTEQKTRRGASNYWSVLKNRLLDEGADELLTNCKQLKMRATDGKMRPTDAADTEQMFRIIQSIPSKKAEPFKQWMAQVAAQRHDLLGDNLSPRRRPMPAGIGLFCLSGTGGRQESEGWGVFRQIKCEILEY